MKKIAVLIIILLACANFVFAEYKVKIIKGDAWVLQKGRKWVELTNNSIIKKKDTIKTGKDAVIQLIRKGGKKVLIKGMNVFKVSTVMKGKNNEKMLRLLHFKNKLKSLIKIGSETESEFVTSAGVRGKDETNKKGLAWLEDDFPDDMGYNALEDQYVMGNFGVVIENGEKFTRQYKNYKNIGEVYFMIGNAYFNFADYSQAGKMVQKALEKSKKKETLEESYFLIGLSYCYLSQEKKAIQYFKDYLKRYPDGQFLAEAVFAVGLSYEEMNKIKDAEKFYNNIKKQ